MGMYGSVLHIEVILADAELVTMVEVLASALRLETRRLHLYSNM